MYVKLKVSDFDGLVSNPRELHLKMPVWTPGSYLVRDFSRNIPEISAFDAITKRSLKCYKVSKSEWVIETTGSSEIEINYRTYTFEFTVDTSYLDNLHAIINGASVFIYVDGMESKEGTLNILPYAGWNTISTGLQKLPGETWKFTFPNYDVLIDSPIEIGNLSLHQFGVDDTKYEVSIFCRSKFNEEGFISDLRKIVETTTKVFRDVPFERYVFIVDLMGDGSFGGLEHLNSTHCIAPILRLDPPEEYHRLLSLFSHEFLHAWNVKRMRPKGLGPFDYGRETYTKSLWIAEGITSYYDDLLIHRAGISTVSEYLDAFSVNISQMKSLPGSRLQSAQESSFDSWIKYYKQNENSPNVIFSYYTQGSVIGWMLDMEIRKSTGLARNLDEVMRKTYRDTYVSEDRGYTDEEFERICVEISGSNSVKQIFEERVVGRMDVDYDRFLGYSGLKLIPKKEEKNLGFLGVRIKEDGGRTIVTHILSSSPAEESGLSANDEILGVNGLRMDRTGLAFYLASRKPADLLSLIVSRQGSLLQLEGRLIVKPTLEYRIAKKDQATEDERRFFESWLGSDWSNEIRYSDYQSLPTRPNILEYI